MAHSFYEQQPSRHSLVDHYWHMRETANGVYPLYVTVKWGMVFFEHDGRCRATIVGPRTSPGSAPFRAGEYIWGVTFQGDVLLSGHIKHDLLNQVIDVPIAGDRLTIAEHEFAVPVYDQLDDFVDQLVRSGVVATAPIAAVSHRDRQRKMKRYTGLTPKQIEQAARVDHALELLSQPLSFADIAARAGFADQPHMNRDFVRFVGHTPRELRRLFGDKD